jgi:hypothetical protein
MSTPSKSLATMTLTPLTLRLFRELPGAGSLPAGAGTYRGEAGGRQHGTHVKYHLQVLDGIVKAARFQAYGCPHTLAACALVAERLQGRPVAQGVGSAPPDWAHELCVPIEKLGRLLVIEDAVFAAFRAAQLPVK